MNQKVIFGTLAIATVIATFGAAIVGGIQSAEAQRVVGADQSNRAASQEGVVNAQVGVNANVQVGQVCVQALADQPRCQ